MTLTRGTPYTVLGATVHDLHHDGQRIGSLHQPDGRHWLTVCGRLDGWRSVPAVDPGFAEYELMRHRQEKHT